MSQRTHKQSVDEFRVARFDELQAENAQLRSKMREQELLFADGLEKLSDIARDNESLRLLVRRLADALVRLAAKTRDHRNLGDISALISEARAAAEGSK